MSETNDTLFLVALELDDAGGRQYSAFAAPSRTAMLREIITLQKRDDVDFQLWAYPSGAMYTVTQALPQTLAHDREFVSDEQLLSYCTRIGSDAAKVSEQYSYIQTVNTTFTPDNIAMIADLWEMSPGEVRLWLDRNDNTLFALRDIKGPKPLEKLFQHRYANIAGIIFFCLLAVIAVISSYLEHTFDGKLAVVVLAMPFLMWVLWDEHKQLQRTLFGSPDGKETIQVTTTQALVNLLKRPYKKVLFIHRSVGNNIIRKGHLSSLLQYAAYQANVLVSFQHINNNKNKRVPGRDTTPADFAKYFAHHALTEDLVIVKSCYSLNALKSDEAVTQLKQDYETMAKNFAKKSKGALMIMSAPPLRPSRTTAAEAKRARDVARWLSHHDFGKRVTVFDLIDMLAEKRGPQAGMLRESARRLAPWDSHPNRRASHVVAHELAEMVVDILQ